MKSCLTMVLLRFQFWERVEIFSWAFWWVLAKGFTNGMWCIFSMPHWVEGLLILCRERIYNITTHMRIWVGVWLLALRLWFRSPRNAVWKHPSPVLLQLELCSGWRPQCVHCEAVALEIGLCRQCWARAFSGVVLVVTCLGFVAGKGWGNLRVGAN